MSDTVQHALTPAHQARSSGPDCTCGWFQSWPREPRSSGIFRKEYAAHLSATAPVPVAAPDEEHGDE